MPSIPLPAVHPRILTGSMAAFAAPRWKKFLLPFLVAAASSTHAANIVWNNAATGGFWNTTTNWVGGVPADGTGSIADFSTLDLTADNTVHLDGAHTLNGLIFGDTTTASAAGWTLDNNGSAANALTLGGTTPTITVNALAAGKSAKVSAEITGTAGLTIAGAGALNLAGVNTFTGGLTLNSTGLTTISGTNVAQTWAISDASYVAGVLISNSGAFASGSTINIATATNNFPIGLGIADNTAGIVGAGSAINITSTGGRGTIGLGTGTNLGANITLTGAVALQIITGSGTTISGNLTFITAGSALGIRNDLTPTAGVTKSNTGTLTIAGNLISSVAGAGGITAPNTFTGTLALTGDNSAYSGNIGTAGLAALSFSQNLGTGTVSLGNTTVAATLNYTGTGSTTAAILNLSGTTGGATINQNGTGALLFTSNLTATGVGAKTLTLTGSTAGTGEISGAIINGSGTTAVTKAGTGTWTLSGASNYTGATAVNAGTLNLTGSLTSAVTVASGATLTGTGSTTGTITFSAGSGVVASATGVQGSNVTANATTNVFVTAAPTGSPATLAIVRHTGTLTGLANFTPATNYRAGSITDTAGTVSLTYTGEAKNWNDADGTWDLATSSPWTGGDTKFSWGDSVAFGNIAADRVATLTGTLAPSSIAVSNAANKYTFSGTGSIAGASALTKSGLGTLVLSTANTYNGGTAINAGRVVLGNAAGLGTGAATVASGAALDVAGLNATTPIAISGTGDGTIPALYNSSTTAGGAVSSLRLNADASIGSAIANDFTKQFGISGLNLNGKKLTIASGTVGIGLSNIPDGNIDVNSGGRLVLLTGGTLTNVTGTITVKTGGILDTRDSDNSTALSAQTIALNGGTLGNGLSANNNGGGIGAKLKNNVIIDATNGGIINGNSAFANPVRLFGSVSGSGPLTVSGGRGMEFDGDVSGYTGTISGGTGPVAFSTTGTQVFNGVIAGARAVSKAGAGTTTLLGNNSYTGATTISGGVLPATVLANGGTNSTIGTSTNVAGNLVFGAPTATLRYTGSTNVTTNRSFTLSSGAGGGGTIESSGTGTLSFDNTIALAYGTANETRSLTLGGTNAGANTFAKVLADNGAGITSLTKAGTGAWALTGSSTYTGNTTISGGTLEIGGAGKLGTSGTYAGTIANAGTLLFSTSANQTLSGVVSGSGALTKSGPGTLTLAPVSADTYTGATSVNGGTLVVSGSLSGTASVNVGSSGTLASSGFFGSITTTAGGNISVAGSLAPGDVGSLDTLTLAPGTGGKLTFLPTSTYKFDISGTSSDEVSFQTADDWLAGSGNLTLALAGLTAGDYTTGYTVFQNVTTPGFTLAAVTGYDTVNYSANFAQFGSDYVLTFNAIPEPGSVASLLGGLGALAALRRRRAAKPF